MCLAGGIEQMGFQCGILWGAALAAGAQAYQVYGPGPQAETAAIIASQRLVEVFQARYKAINCAELTGTEWKTATGHDVLRYFVKGGPVRCVAMAASYAPMAFDEINAVLSAAPGEAPCNPASCAACLARKMGASDMHAVMAAGLAGGIGLSGGACGALGAAIWLIGVKAGKDDGAKIDFNNPKAMDTIDRFVAASGGEFECSAIAGRKFEDAPDHARYLAGGGCASVIEALAGQGE